MSVAIKVESEKLYTLEEFIALEQTSDLRHEFYDGRLIPLEATTIAHNRIKRNIIRPIETPEFDKKGCILCDENVLTQLQEHKKYVYPDIVVSCDKREDNPLIVQFPMLVVEILSPSTKRYDKTTKFFKYQRIPSLMQCIFVAQDAVEVHSFVRNEEDVWVLTLLSKLEDKLNIVGLNVSIPLADVYSNVKIVET